MSDGPKKVNLAEYRERKENQGAIDVEAPSGRVFRIPPAELWPDEVPFLRGDLPAQAAAIMGAEEFDAFKAEGGTANILDAIIKDEHGAEAGK